MSGTFSAASPSPRFPVNAAKPILGRVRQDPPQNPSAAGCGRTRPLQVCEISSIFATMIKYVLLFFLLIFLLLAGYVAWRTWCILPLALGWKILIITIYALAVGCMFINFGLKGRLPMGPATVSYELGNSWLIFFVYALILFVLLDLGRAFRFVPSTFLHGSWTGTLTVFGLIAAALVRRHGPDRKDWVHIILFLLGIGIVIGMEFAKDKLPALPIWSCYAIMAAASAMMGVVTWRLVFRKPAAQL